MQLGCRLTWFPSSSPTSVCTTLVWQPISDYFCVSDFQIHLQIIHTRGSPSDTCSWRKNATGDWITRPHANAVGLWIHCPSQPRAEQSSQVGRLQENRFQSYTVHVFVREAKQCKTIQFDTRVTRKNSNLDVGVNIPSDSLSDAFNADYCN